MRMPKRIPTEVEIHRRRKFYHGIHTALDRLNLPFFLLAVMSLVANTVSVQMYGTKIGVSVSVLFILTMLGSFISERLTELSTFVDEPTMQALLHRSISYPQIHANLMDYILVRPLLTRYEHLRFLTAIEHPEISQDSVGQP